MKTPDLSPRQSELLKWFETHAPALAEAYEGAVKLLAAEHFPGRMHFISHAVRDIADRLPFILDPQLSGQRVQYENELDSIEKHWPSLESIRTTSPDPDLSETVTLDLTLARRIDRLVAAHRERRRRPSNAELLFRFLMRNEPSGGSLSMQVVERFASTRRYFMEFAHLRNEPLEVPEGELRHRFNDFEATLHSFVGAFFTGTAELDAILQQTNERAD